MQPNLYIKAYLGDTAVGKTRFIVQEGTRALADGRNLYHLAFDEHENGLKSMYTKHPEAVVTESDIESPDSPLRIRSFNYLYTTEDTWTDIKNVISDINVENATIIIDDAHFLPDLKIKSEGTYGLVPHEHLLQLISENLVELFGSTSLQSTRFIVVLNCLLEFIKSNNFPSLNGVYEEINYLERVSYLGGDLSYLEVTDLLTTSRRVYIPDFSTCSFVEIPS